MGYLGILIKSNLIKQMRSYRFFFIMAISIFLGCLCVPGASAGYEIFYLGGVRGIYNSAWLGTLGAMLPVILLWLPGFYLLRSQITEDYELKVGQMISASPISKWDYIFGKFISNFAVLMVLQLVFLMALMMMQWIQHESMKISLMQYIQPLLWVTIPYLIVLAACTVFFDTVSFLRGSIGNIIIFVFWITFSSLSVMKPGSLLDLFHMGTLLQSMMEGAKTQFPHLPEVASFGYYKVEEGNHPTFVWKGIVWGKEFLEAGLMWIAVALVLVAISTVVFNRFKETPNKKNRSNGVQIISEKNGVNNQYQKDNQNRKSKKPILSPIIMSKQGGFFGIVLSELKMMVRGRSKWWYVTVFVVMCMTPFVTPGDSLKWISLTMLLPLSMWSQMGNRDQSCGTSEIIASTSSQTLKWVGTWFAGLVVALMMSLGMFTRIVMLSEWHYLSSWGAGMVFIPTLALILGSISGSNRLFEAVFIVLMYFGAINNMWKFDFMGLCSNHTLLYIGLTLVLLMIGLAWQILKEKHLLNGKLKYVRER